MNTKAILTISIASVLAIGMIVPSLASEHPEYTNILDAEVREKNHPKHPGGLKGNGDPHPRATETGAKVELKVNATIPNDAPDGAFGWAVVVDHEVDQNNATAYVIASHLIDDSEPQTNDEDTSFHDHWVFLEESSDCSGDPDFSLGALKLLDLTNQTIATELEVDGNEVRAWGIPLGSDMSFESGITGDPLGVNATKLTNVVLGFQLYTNDTASPEATCVNVVNATEAHN